MPTPLFGRANDSLSTKSNIPAFGQKAPSFGGTISSPLFGNKSSTSSPPVFGKSNTPLFGGQANLPNFASLTSDSDTEKTEPTILGSKTNIDFSSLAKGENTNIFASKSSGMYIEVAFKVLYPF